MDILIRSTWARVPSKTDSRHRFESKFMLVQNVDEEGNLAGSLSVVTEAYELGGPVTSIFSVFNDFI